MWATGEVCVNFHSLHKSLMPFGIEPLHLVALLYNFGGDRSPDIHYEPCAKLKALSRLWALKLNDPPVDDFRQLLDVPLPGRTPSESEMQQLIVGYCVLMDLQAAVAAG